jgi:ATP-dependent RNA helicase RhlB
MKFDELKIDPRLLRGIRERGYTEMTAVQEKTLARSLEGTDVAVQSQTGTGKTAAFLITLFNRMSADGAGRRKRALIIVPTRELAVQIEKEARLLNRHLRFSIGSFYGGVGYEAQLSSLRKGLDVAVGTPGRLIDLSDRGALKLGEIELLVIDEADRLLDMGFLPDIKKLIQKMPPCTARQTLLFSATLNRVSRNVAAGSMNHPTFIEVTPERLTVGATVQELYHVKNQAKISLMLGILKAEAPRNALIFTNMKHSASRLSKKLQSNGFTSQHLTGDLSQNRRLRVIEDFGAGKFPFLVATDVAARGLHIDDLELVINFDLPLDRENYVHRIGRTARAGNTGKAISLAGEDTAGRLADIESFIGMKIPVQTADANLYAAEMSPVHDPNAKKAPQKGGFQRPGRPAGGARKPWEKGSGAKKSYSPFHKSGNR